MKRRLLVLLAVVAVVAAAFVASARTVASSGHAVADPGTIVTSSDEGFLDGH